MLLSVSGAFGSAFSFNSYNSHDGEYVGILSLQPRKDHKPRGVRWLIHGHLDSLGPRLGPSDSGICGLIFNKQ